MLFAAITAAGGRVENSEAGLYLWTTFGEDTWASIERLAKLGIVAGPGAFYGEDGAGYVRIGADCDPMRILRGGRASDGKRRVGKRCKK